MAKSGSLDGADQEEIDQKGELDNQVELRARDRLPVGKLPSSAGPGGIGHLHPQPKRKVKLVTKYGCGPGCHGSAPPYLSWGLLRAPAPESCLVLRWKGARHAEASGSLASLPRFAGPPSF